MADAAQRAALAQVASDDAELDEFSDALAEDSEAAPPRTDSAAAGKAGKSVDAGEEKVVDARAGNEDERHFRCRMVDLKPQCVQVDDVYP